MRQQRRRLIFQIPFIIGLMLLGSHCAGNKTQLPNPGFRGLTPSEAMTLEALNRPPVNRRQWTENLDQKLLSPEALGDALLENGQYESALYHYTKLYLSQPQRLDLRYKIGLALYLLGQDAEAAKELTAVVAADPEMIPAQEILGLILLREKKYAEARRQFNLVLQLNPNRRAARYYLGTVCLASGDFAGAVAELTRAYGADPRDHRIPRDLGWAYYQQKRYDQALQWLQKAAQLQPTDQATQQRLGMVLAALKRYPEALVAYQRAGDEAQAYNNIGVHYFLDGRYLEAAKCFKKALELRPTFYQEAKENLGRALQKLQEEGDPQGHAYQLSQQPASRTELKAAPTPE